MNNQSRSQNWLLPGIVSVIAALLLTFLLAPLLAGWLNVPLPSWLSVGALGGQQASAGLGSGAMVDTAEEEAWPTPPADFLAASGLITETVAGVTRTPASTATPRPTPTILVLPTPSWEEMNYLTSVKFTASTIVEAERATTIALLGDITTDRLLLKVVGNILVGVDLSRVSNVEIDGDTIHLSLPEPEIMTVELLPKESRIYESTRTLFLSQYDGLETDALEQARQQLRIEILQNQGLMEMARDMSRLQLIEFLESVGYREVEVDFPYLNTRPRG